MAVRISLDELERGLSGKCLNEAFGPDSLGIILVDGLPEEFHYLRSKILKQATLLSKLDEADLNEMECEEAFWLVGWSMGKEKLSIKNIDGTITKKPDYLKGSYYANCSFYVDSDLEGLPEAEQEKYGKYKAYSTLNKWPKLKTVLLNRFELDFKRLCCLVIDVAAIVAKSCDKLIENENNMNTIFEKDFLQSVVKESYTTKARLLHYYPANENNADNDWCGEHLDHSCLTGLTSSMFLDESTIANKTIGEITLEDVENLKELDCSPDPESGLYIKNRHNEVVKINIPRECLAFQTGSALQEISQNNFKAVPHYVKGCNIKNISRNTLAVFCQPNLGVKVNRNETFCEYADRILLTNH